MDYFDKALNSALEGIERNVVDQVREAASAALEEYPGQDQPDHALAPAGWLFSSACRKTSVLLTLILQQGCRYNSCSHLSANRYCKKLLGVKLKLP
jgi:hypothetical protein